MGPTSSGLSGFTQQTHPGSPEGPHVPISGLGTGDASMTLINLGELTVGPGRQGGPLESSGSAVQGEGTVGDKADVRNICTECSKVSRDFGAEKEQGHKGTVSPRLLEQCEPGL